MALDRRDIVSRRRIVDGRKRAARAAQRRVTGGPQKRRDDDGRHAASEVTMSIVGDRTARPAATSAARRAESFGASRQTDGADRPPHHPRCERQADRRRHRASVPLGGRSGRPIASGRTNAAGRVRVQGAGAGADQLTVAAERYVGLVIREEGAVAIPVIGLISGGPAVRQGGFGLPRTSAVERLVSPMSSAIRSLA